MVSVDFLQGPQFDLRRTAVYLELKGWLLSGLVWGIFAGTPCETFSRARRAPPGSSFPGPLRSAQQPRGLAGLTGKDLRRIRDANAVSDRAAILLRIGYERGLVGGEENPASSILWLTKQRLQQAKLDNVEDFVVDHCAFGTPYRARTRFRLFNVGQLPLLHEKRCSGHGICSFSGKAHVWLSGAASSGGGFKTKVKAAYPKGLCNLLAGHFASSFQNRMTARRWKLMSGA